VVWREGNTYDDGMQVITRSGGVWELGMCGHSLRGNRETSERSLWWKLKRSSQRYQGRLVAVAWYWFLRGVGHDRSTWEVGEQRGYNPCGADGGKVIGWEEVKDSC